MGIAKRFRRIRAAVKGVYIELRIWMIRSRWLPGRPPQPRRLKRVYPGMPDRLREQWTAVEKSFDGTLEYAPSQITLTSGAVLDRVYLVDASNYVRSWGVEPSTDTLIDIRDVATIASSPFRLSARFANLLYSLGETSMGGMEFAAVLDDDRWIRVSMGNVIDYPDWPDGVDPAAVVNVIHGRRGPLGDVGVGAAAEEFTASGGTLLHAGPAPDVVLCLFDREK